MKRMCLVAAALLAGWLGAVAQESPEAELDFVKKLRAKGYYDLSKEYIDGLRKRMPQLGGQLDLEQARALVSLGREKDLTQRAALFGQASDLFQQFVKKFEGKPEAVQARLELAKLVAYHGQALLTKALREEEAKDQHEAARPAEAKFVLAGEQLDVVIKQLQDKEQTQARFDRGVNYIDQARTYLDLSKEAHNTRRAELVNEAKKLFDELSKDDASDVGLLAHAWLVKCYQESQDPTSVIKHYKKVMESKAAKSAAEPAQRLARYFYLQWAVNDPAHAKKTPAEKIKIVENEATKWLADYKGNLAALRSWEGQGVRFELANAYITQAQITHKTLNTPAATPLLTKAQKLYDELANLDGDFSEDSRRRAIGVAALKLEKTKLEEIRDFDNAFLKAHVELNKFKGVTADLADPKANEKERPKLEAAKKQHLRDTLRAINLALGMIDSRTPVQKVDDIRWLLATFHYGTGDLYRTAVASESLARVRPPSKRGPQGAGLALLVLDTIATRDPSEANKQKVRDLAEFILAPETQKFWMAEQISSVARFQMAMIFNKENNYKGAIGYLEQLPSEFPGYLYAQGQLVFIALGAAQEKAESDDEKRLLRKKAREAIQRMPETLPADADPSTAIVYYMAKMELSKFWYSDAAADLEQGKLAEAAAKYKQMGKFVGQHFDTFTKSKISIEDDKKAQLNTLMTVLQKYSRLGLADVEYRLGNYDKVLGDEFTGPVVKELVKLAEKPGPIRRKDVQVTGDTVGLALRANIQKGDFDAAKSLFEVLDRLAGEEEGLAVDSTNMMKSLLQDMQLQVKDYKKAKNVEKLKTTTENFSKFIDDIGATILKKKAGARDYAFLSSAYASLDQPAKAAELLKKVAEPKGLEGKQLADEDKPAVQEYWAIRLQLGKALREAKDYKGALGVLNHLINHPHGQYHIVAEFEKNFVLHDNNLWGPAIKSWSQIMPRLQQRAAQDVEVKKWYFEAYYYHAFAWYKHSQSEKIKGTAKEAPALTPAANYILRLETSANRDGWNLVGERFQELLEAEPPLKAMYEKLKKPSGG